MKRRWRRPAEQRNGAGDEVRIDPGRFDAEGGRFDGSSATANSPSLFQHDGGFTPFATHVRAVTRALDPGGSFSNQRTDQLLERADARSSSRKAHRYRSSTIPRPVPTSRETTAHSADQLLRDHCADAQARSRTRACRSRRACADGAAGAEHPAPRERVGDVTADPGEEKGPTSTGFTAKASIRDRERCAGSSITSPPASRRSSQRMSPATGTVDPIPGTVRTRARKSSGSPPERPGQEVTEARRSRVRAHQVRRPRRRIRPVFLQVCRSRWSPAGGAIGR
jgi:hypothetical protein